MRIGKAKSDLASTGAARDFSLRPGGAPCTPAAAAAARIAATHRDIPGALLPILHAVQDELGCIPADAVEPIAQALNLSRAEVHGVITFYPHFRGEPAGRRMVEVCRAESCQAMGADALARHIGERLGCDFHATSADGGVTLEPVYCLGLCAQSPAIAVDGRPYARMTPQAFDRLMEEAAGETADATRTAAKPAGLAQGLRPAAAQAGTTAGERP